MAIAGDTKVLIDGVAKRILDTQDVSQKIEVARELSEFINIKTTSEIKKQRDEQFRSNFTWFVIALYVVTTGCIFYLIYKAFFFDLDMIGQKSEKYTRLIDAKVVIALITGVVLQAGAAFAILAKFVYHLDGTKPDKPKPN